MTHYKFIRTITTRDLKISEIDSSTGQHHGSNYWNNFCDSHNIIWWDEVGDLLANHLPYASLCYFEPKDEYYLRFTSKQELVEFVIKYG